MSDERDPATERDEAPAEAPPASNVLPLKPRARPAPPPADDDRWPPGAA